MTPTLGIALRDLRHEWRASLCFVAALVGVLAPMLTIYALKNGVIEGMVDQLVENPANRELIAVGSGAHAPDFFARLDAREDVAFIVPATRTINASANAVRHPPSRRLERAVPLIPSAAGDPLTTGRAMAPGEAQASAALLEALGAAVGDQVEIVIGREIDGRREAAEAVLTLVGAVPATHHPRPALFLALDDLLAVEAFRDRPEVSVATWRSPTAMPERYASFRLYARDLSDLAPLQADLEREGVRVRPRAENAVLLLAFRDNLNLLFAIIASLALGGFWAAMAANLRGMVERQRAAFSLLALVGMTDLNRRLIPLFQSLVLVVSGILLTVMLVLPLLAIVNSLFAGGTVDMVAVLGWKAVFWTLLIGAATAATASLWAISSIGGIGPDEVLRHA